MICASGKGRRIEVFDARRRPSLVGYLELAYDVIFE